MRLLARFLARSPQRRTPAWQARRGRVGWLATVVQPFLLGALVTLAVGSFACGEASFKPGALVDEQKLFWSLALNHHAILLSTRAPYDTLRLVATPRNYHGDVLAGLVPTFRSEDHTKVIVSPDGLLQALAPMPPNTVIKIIATLTTGNLRHADTAWVRVTDADPLPMLGSLSIHPIPPDSAKVPAVLNESVSSLYRGPSPRATDVDGAPIPTMPGDTEGAGVLPVAFRSADTTVLVIFSQYNQADGSWPVSVGGYQPGTVAVYATTTAFGVTKADTLPFRVGAPLMLTVFIYPPEADWGRGMRSSNIFTNGSDIRIGVGGVVSWTPAVVNGDSNLVADVVFHEADLPNIRSATPWLNFNNDPTIIDYGGYSGPLMYFYQCTPLGWKYINPDCVNSGNFVVGPTAGATAGGTGYDVVTRRFVAPGTYEYASTRYPGSQGRIIVVDER